MKFNISTITNLPGLVRSLISGMTKLNFQDNFESFEVQGIEIAGGTTISIRNELTFIPSKYIIVKQIGEGLVTTTDKAWTLKEVNLRNHGTTLVKVSVVFMR